MSWKPTVPRRKPTKTYAKPSKARREAAKAVPAPVVLGASLPQPKRPQGRPRVYGEDVYEEILDRMVKGESLVKICEEPDMPEPQAVSWRMAQDPELKARYKTAGIARSITLVEKSLDAVNNAQDRDQAYVADTKARNWMKIAAVTNPEQFSDKLHSTMGRTYSGAMLSINININGEDVTANLKTIDGDSERVDG
jgi:hypothetical protein